MEEQCLLSPGANNSTGINFLAHGLRVDNPTAQWWYIPSGDQYVPPYTGGWSAPLDGTRVMDVRSRPPPGQITNRLTNIAELATFHWTSETQPFSAGFPMGNQPSLLPQQNNIVYAAAQIGPAGIGGVSGFLFPAITNYRIRLTALEIVILNMSASYCYLQLEDTTLVLPPPFNPSIRTYACGPRSVFNLDISDSAGLFMGTVSQGLGYYLSIVGSGSVLQLYAWLYGSAIYVPGVTL